MLNTLDMKTLKSPYDHGMLGRLVITGDWTDAIDPFSTQSSDRKTRVFRIVPRGFVCWGTLYQTLDATVLRDALGVTEASHKYCVNPKLIK